ncbi:MAG TPA: ABC transporter ATP-binding protein [Acidimicrobiales bacterium]|nr:ABC transporter ATP-binding protein [Acidimicrobiales bacterium]
MSSAAPRADDGAAATGPAVAAVDVTKRFPGVIANDGVTFDALPGEVHALLGENGAGKTTLCKILTGLWKPDSGEVTVGGRPARFRSPRDAHAAGIFMIHQHLRLVDSMTVAENVVLGWSRRRGWRFSPKRVEQEVAEVAEQFHMPVDPDAKVWQLSLGQRQRVEILKALYRGARILVLDEPTTVLTPQEIDQLLDTVRQLVASGGTVIFISHKLPEVTAIADRVTILRHGRSIRTVPLAGTDPGALAEMMVGRQVSESVRPPEAAPETGEPVLEVTDLTAEGDLGIEALHGVSLTVQQGEILGIAGVAGNGQRELAEVVAGIRPHTGGTVRVGGRVLPPGDARAAIEHGVAYVPEDRMGTGIAPGLSIADNVILKSYRSGTMSRGPLLRRHATTATARDLMERYTVRAPGPGTLVGRLSGGNVQRVLLARELSSEPRVVVAASPTRGLDVGSTNEIRRILMESADRGVGVLLMSEDLDEVLSVADRVAVFYEGRVVGVVRPAEVSREQIGLMMAGASG